jgi:serine/threonine protein kinase
MKSLGPRFEVERLLGRGLTSEVWLARDLELGRTVAVQTPGSDAPAEVSSRLERAYEITRWLDHPNILRVDDLIIDDGRPLLVMEAAPGGNLSRLCCQPVTAILKTAIPIARALHFAHERGVVHGGLSLRNVVLRSDGTPLLTGFGRAVHEPQGGPTSAAEQPATLSPQQRRGEPPSPGDDIFAFGAVLTELLTGHLPDPAAPARSAVALLDKNDDLPEPIGELIVASLAHERHDRPPDLGSVASQLEMILANLRSVGDDDPSPDRDLRPPPRVALSAPGGTATVALSIPRRLALVALAGALLAALVVVFLVLPRWVADRPPGPPGQQADLTGRPSAPTAPPTVGVAPSRTPAHATVNRTPQGTPVGGPIWRPTPTPDSSRSAFVDAMSRGLNALETADWDRAHEAFTTAGAIRPGAPEVADGLARAVAGRRRAELADLEGRGRALVDREAWQAAAAIYTRALEVDSTASFAQLGLALSTERAVLDDRLQYHLKNLDRLTSPTVREAATEFLADAREVEPRGPRLAGQIEALEAALRRAAEPVPVVFLSDGETTVEVLRVGALGSFERTELMLLPGRYTVTGSRKGYRSVRVLLEVKAGAPPAPCDVRCQERL